VLLIGSNDAALDLGPREHWIIRCPRYPRHDVHDDRAGHLGVWCNGRERASLEAGDLARRGGKPDCEHRAQSKGPGSPCPPDLLRLSTGIEDVEDLYSDLDAALQAIG
jgi:cystathionine gamma-synthase